MRRVTKSFISLILVTFFSCVTLFHFAIPVHAEDMDYNQYLALRYFIWSGGTYVDNDGYNITLNGSSTVQENVTLNNVKLDSSTGKFSGNIGNGSATNAKITCTPSTTSSSTNPRYDCVPNNYMFPSYSMNNVTFDVGDFTVTGGETITGTLSYDLSGTISKVGNSNYILQPIKGYTEKSDPYFYNLEPKNKYYLVFGTDLNLSNGTYTYKWGSDSAVTNNLKILYRTRNLTYLAAEVDASNKNAAGNLVLKISGLTSTGYYYPLFFGSESQMSEGVNKLVFGVENDTSLVEADNTNTDFVDASNTMEDLESGYRSDFSNAVSNISFGGLSGSVPSRYNFVGSMRWVSSTFQRCLIPPLNYVLRYSLIIGLTGMLIGKLRK